MFARRPTSQLVVFSNCKDPAREEEFSRWYDTVHLPNMFTVPDVLAAQRYQCVFQRAGKAQYVAAYDLAIKSLGKFEDDLWELRKREAAKGQTSQLIRVPVSGVYIRIGEEQRGRAWGKRPTDMLVVVSNCADMLREFEFNRWYDLVHLPKVLKLPQVVSAQRYRCLHQRFGLGAYMAVYDIATNDLQKLDKDLLKLVEDEKKRGERPVPELNAHVISGVYAPMGGRQRRPA